MWFLFFAIWIILNGRITAEIVLFGIGAATVLCLFIVKVFRYQWHLEITFVKNFPIMVFYVLNLIREVILASLATSRRIWGRKGTDAVLVEFDSGFRDNVRNVLLANSITLTPGTYTVAMENGIFLVACLCPEFAEGIDDSSFIRILRKMSE
ncbi:MAG: Na+/H+ antiporter subunit E [Lachnospiraceae bacterium]|nr:Na+/H+ antiporter subunit E [Lachnospiraceae bacterium]